MSLQSLYTGVVSESVEVSMQDVGRSKPVSSLEVGDILVVESPCPSSEGFVHRVDDIREIGSGCTRVWVDVLEWDGAERTRYDRLFWDGDEDVEVVS
jgi:hypothetical protein